MMKRPHPDSHELDDWPLYGPKDSEIGSSVGQLAYGHGLRLVEIEAIIAQALRERIARENARQT